MTLANSNGHLAGLRNTLNGNPRLTQADMRTYLAEIPSEIKPVAFDYVRDHSKLQLRQLLDEPISVDNWHAIHNILSYIPAETYQFDQLLNVCKDEGIESKYSDYLHFRMKEGPLQNKDGLKVSPFFQHRDVEIKAFDENWLLYEGLQSIDADGYGFEWHPRLKVSQDILRFRDGYPNFVHIEVLRFIEEVENIPSSATQCNFLVEGLRYLERNQDRRDDPQISPLLERIKRLFQQYLDPTMYYEEGLTSCYCGSHLANNFFKYGGKEAKYIHHPLEEEKRTEIDFIVGDATLIDPDNSSPYIGRINLFDDLTYAVLRGVSNFSGRGEDPDSIIFLARFLGIEELCLDASSQIYNGEQFNGSFVGTIGNTFHLGANYNRVWGGVVRLVEDS